MCVYNNTLVRIHIIWNTTMHLVSTAIKTHKLWLFLLKRQTFVVTCQTTAMEFSMFFVRPCLKQQHTHTYIQISLHAHITRGLTYVRPLPHPAPVTVLILFETAAISVYMTPCNVHISTDVIVTLEDFWNYRVFQPGILYCKRSIYIATIYK